MYASQDCPLSLSVTSPVAGCASAIEASPARATKTATAGAISRKRFTLRIGTLLVPERLLENPLQSLAGTHFPPALPLLVRVELLFDPQQPSLHPLGVLPRGVQLQVPSQVRDRGPLVVKMPEVKPGQFEMRLCVIRIQPQ